MYSIFTSLWDVHRSWFILLLDQREGGLCRYRSRSQFYIFAWIMLFKLLSKTIYKHYNIATLFLVKGNWWNFYKEFFIQYNILDILYTFIA